ncbi:7959_t:CDS:2, partial [Dentiscutata heterogama]
HHENDNIQSDENEEDSSDENDTDLSDDDERKKEDKNKFFTSVIEALGNFYDNYDKEQTKAKRRKKKKKTKRTDYNFGDKENIICNPPTSFYTKIPEEDTIDKFSKTSDTVELKFNEKNVASKKVDKKDQKKVYDLILKDQPKTVQIIISAIDTSNSYIDYVLSTWKNPSDYYSEKNAIQ